MLCHLIIMFDEVLKDVPSYRADGIFMNKLY